jgi:hypothetical protein
MFTKEGEGARPEIHMDFPEDEDMKENENIFQCPMSSSILQKLSLSWHLEQRKQKQGENKPQVNFSKESCRRKGKVSCERKCGLENSNCFPTAGDKVLSELQGTPASDSERGDKGKKVTREKESNAWLNAKWKPLWVPQEILEGRGEQENKVMIREEQGREEK